MEEGKEGGRGRFWRFLLPLLFLVALKICLLRRRRRRLRRSRYCPFPTISSHSSVSGCMSASNEYGSRFSFLPSHSGRFYLVEPKISRTRLWHSVGPAFTTIYSTCATKNSLPFWTWRRAEEGGHCTVLFQNWLRANAFREKHDRNWTSFFYRLSRSLPL